MYHFGKVLGTGSFGVVRLVMHKLTGTKTAVKTYDKRKIKDSAHLKRVHTARKEHEAIVGNVHAERQVQVPAAMSPATHRIRVSCGCEPDI